MNNNRSLLCMYIHANEKFCVISRKSRFYFRTFRVIMRKCNFSPTKIRSISFRRVGIWLYQNSAAIFMLICETIPCQFRTFLVKKIKTRDFIFDVLNTTISYIAVSTSHNKIQRRLYRRLTTKTSSDCVNILGQTLARVAIISKSYDKTNSDCINVLRQKLAKIVSTSYNKDQQQLYLIQHYTT